MGSEWACTLQTHASHSPLPPSDPVIRSGPRDGPMLGSCTSTPPAHASAYKPLTQNPVLPLLGMSMVQDSCPPLRNASLELACCMHMPLTPADPVHGLGPRDGPVLGSCTPTSPAHAFTYKRLTQDAPPPMNCLLDTPFCHLLAWGWCLLPRACTMCTHETDLDNMCHNVFVAMIKYIFI